MMQNGRVVVQNVQGRHNRVQGNNARGVVAAGNGGGGAHYKAVNANGRQGNAIKFYNCNGIGHDNAVDEDVDEPPVQDLALNVDNVFQADDYPVYDKASSSYDSDILSEVPDHDNYQDAVYEHNDVHEMHYDVQPNYIIDSHADYTSDSNMILYDQYVKDNAVPVLQSNVSSIPNDAYMIIINKLPEQATQCAFLNEKNKVVNASLTAELTRYKEQVELYESRAKFEFTEREQKIDKQLIIVITDRNIKEENLKMELHSVKLQLNSTINHNKSMVEEFTSLKKDFKQNENKYLEEFLDMKELKEKDVLKIKSKALKEQTKALTPITALTVYPPNTAAKLVPKVLPT
ncbi:hypothetical protein Tco_0086858 [Tanacetum coccineum]